MVVDTIASLVYSSILLGYITNALSHGTAMESCTQLHRIPSIPFVNHTRSNRERAQKIIRKPRQDWSGAPPQANRLGVRAILHWADSLILWKHSHERAKGFQAIRHQPILVKLFGTWTHAHVVSVDELTPKMIDVTVRPLWPCSRLSVIRLRSENSYYYVGVRSMTDWWFNPDSIPSDFPTD